MHEQIHDANETGNISGRNEAGEDELFFEIKRAGALNKPFAPRTVTHEQEFQIRKLLKQSRRDGKQVIVALQFEKPGDFADYKIIRRDVPMGAKRRVVDGGQIRGKRKAAEDFGVLRRLANAGGEVLACHGIGHDDEMRGDFASAAFGGAKEAIRQETLKGSERRPVNGVNDDGHAGAMSGKASEETSLAAVGVDNIGMKLAKDTGEMTPGDEVFPGVERADQFRQKGD